MIPDSGWLANSLPASERFSEPPADPDALAAEFAERGVTFSDPLRDTHDGLRGFEISDPDGYVLFFGRPR